MKKVLLLQPHRVMDGCTNSIWNVKEKEIEVPDDTGSIIIEEYTANIGYDMNRKREVAVFPEYATGYQSYRHRLFYSEAEREANKRWREEREKKRAAWPWWKRFLFFLFD